MCKTEKSSIEADEGSMKNIREGDVKEENGAANLTDTGRRHTKVTHLWRPGGEVRIS